MAPQTPAPGASSRLAALTIASTSGWSVMSPRCSSTLATLPPPPDRLPLLDEGGDALRRVGRGALRRHHLRLQREPVGQRQLAALERGPADVADGGGRVRGDLGRQL